MGEIHLLPLELVHVLPTTEINIDVEVIVTEILKLHERIRKESSK